MRSPLAPALAPLLALVLGACGSAAPEPAAESAFVRMAEAVRRASGAADSARHRVERGAPMEQAAGLLVGLLRQAGDAAGELELAAERADSAKDRALLLAAARLTRKAVVVAHREASALGVLAVTDLLLDRAVAGWSDVEHAVAAEELKRRAAWLAGQPAEPPGCPALRDHRVAWLRLVAERSRRLVGHGGAELLGPFLAQPFGVDRRRADVADRDCWLRHGALPAASRQLRELAERWAGSRQAPATP